MLVQNGNAGEHGEKGVSCAFVPVFDNEANAVTAFYCHPAMTGADGKDVADEDLLAQGAAGGSKAVEEKLVLRNMTTIIGAAAKHARKIKLGGEGAKVIVPINGFVLGLRPIATEFTRLCRQLSKEILESLIFEVTNVKDRTSMSFLDDVAVILYPFCETYVARIPPNAMDLKIYSTCNYTGVSVSLQNKPWPVDKVLPYLSRFVAMAESCHLSTYLHGAANREIVAAATEAGVRYVDV